MQDAVCVVEVGVHPGPYWQDPEHPKLIVCDRHRQQYDESDYGPSDWQKFDELAVSGLGEQENK